jgi:Ca2+-binding EF-hand superfamily protein
MSDFATQFLTQIRTATTTTASTVDQSVLSSFEASSSGSISSTQFQQVFAEMLLDQPAQDMGAAAPTSFNVKKTIFDCMLYPSFSTNYATAKYQASEMMTALDKNGDGSVSLAELQAYATANASSKSSSSTSSNSSSSSSTSSTSSSSTSSTDPSATSSSTTTPILAMSLANASSLAETAAATQFATSMMQQFDTANKGYITVSDIQAAYAANPALGDASQAQSIFSQWDANNDGQITQQELVTGYQQNDIATQLMANYDTTNQGYIDLHNLSSAVSTVSPSFVALLTSWDSAGNGQLTQDEIMKGLSTSQMSLSDISSLMETVNASVNAQNMMAQYDTSAKGYADLSDINAALANAQPTAASSNLASQAQNAMNFYDVNGDGQISLGEMVDGQQVFDVASQLMAQFDPSNQGYIDVSATGLASLSSRAPSLASVLSSWNSAGDGHLTQQEIVSGLQTSNIKFLVQSQSGASSTASDPASQAASILSQFDSNFDGQISLSEFMNQATIDPSIASDPITTFNAWDSNHDGNLSLDEIQTGIQTIQQAQTIVSQYDTANKGYFDSADLETALTSADPTLSSSSAAQQAQGIMAFWDANNDGKVTVQEVIQGIQKGGYVGGQQLASSIASASSSTTSGSTSVS